MTQNNKQDLLRQLPGVDSILEKTNTDPRFEDIPRRVTLEAIRTILDQTRQAIIGDGETHISETTILDRTARLANEKNSPNLVTVINATGVVLHTNLGRALLCQDALDNIQSISGAYSNLELNIATGKRGLRYSAIEELICELTGAESAIAVNNNAGAVFLALNTLAAGTEVVVSRGELVEIGGSFRVPDVMAKSGCCLKEVGTTNRTHPRDYRNAVTEHTGLFLKVHTSNYKIQGFTKSVSLEEMADLGNEMGVPVMEDLGSGTFVGFSKYGLPFEPLVSDSIASGADVVTFSGDKLLGGPQAGIIAGKKEALDQIKANPMTRALRIDKMTLAALEATLRLYRDPEKALEEIPTLRMLTMDFEETAQRADAWQKELEKRCGSGAKIQTADLESRPGGGSFPELVLPTRCLTIKPGNISVSRLERLMRTQSPCVIGRIENDQYLIDPRTVQSGQEQIIINKLEALLSNP
ncbi:MAG: L-seryl-tRNA(Sec) selenium transferase [Desulfobacterales bacterium]|nr:L-seryl-tRNA(Sec) selenium transferase [Desulfobacterales bacterium]